MRATVPNSNEVFDKVNALWASARHYSHPNDIGLRQVARLAAQLLKTDAAAGWTVLSSIAALTGDDILTREHADRAIRLSSDSAIVSGKATALSNLGYFSEAGRLFSSILSLDLLPIEHVEQKTIASGSILALDAVLARAGNMPTAVSTDLRKSIELAARIFRKNDVTDRDVGILLDKAGEILRENRFFFIGYPNIFATTEEEFAQVNLSMALDVDSVRAAKLNLEYVSRCFDSGIVPPECLVVSFASAPEINERRAA